MIDGHPSNVSRRVKATIRRAHKHGLVVTATTDPPQGAPGHHSSGSWHYRLKGRNAKGCAVDLGFTANDVARLTPDQRRRKLVAFQLAEYRYAKRLRFRSWEELLGPQTDFVLLSGKRTDLVPGSPLEIQHRNHVHVARSPFSIAPPKPPKPKHVRAAVIARRAGIRNALAVVQEAHAAGVPVSLALAVVEQESGGRNVFGHDPTSSVPAGWKGGRVTRARYLQYKRNRASGGMQGVGPFQLTWWEFQDRADLMGGCWVPRNNIRVGLQILRANIAKHGRFAGIAAYNGSGDAAQNYARSVEARASVWRRRLP
jgi:hypothetical protein